jgi:outer membrane murein-binding lipoprotein Lpp
MADRIDHLTERVQVVEVKVDRLSSTVGQLSTRVDGLTTTVNDLSTAVAAGFVEQREYTEFSHARLEAKMDAGFARIDRKLDQLIDAQHPRSKPNRRNE